MFEGKIRKRFESTLCMLLFLSGISSLVGWLNRRRNRVPILMYHEITNVNCPREQEPCLESLGMIVGRETFENHLQFLKEKYVAISLDSLLDHVKRDKKLPANALVITFDDGMMGNYMNALPLLQRYQMTATFFVIGNTLKGQELWLHRLYDLLDSLAEKETELCFKDLQDRSFRFSLNRANKLEIAQGLKTMLLGLDDGEKRRILDQIAACNKVEEESFKTHYMSQTELEDLVSKGYGLGGHSMGHDKLTRLDPPRLNRDVEECHDLLHQITKTRDIPFAYPFGQKDSFNPNIKTQLAATGFSCAVTTIEGLNDQKSDPFELKRIEIGEFSKAEFMTHVTGTMALMKDIARSIFRH